MQSLKDDSIAVLDALAGTSCSFCDEGRYVREAYKGTDAVVCEACNTPGARVW